MQKALGELEDLKLIYTERTNGKYVTKDQKLLDKFKDKYAKEKTKKYLEEMQELGFIKEKIIEYLKEDNI